MPNCAAGWAGGEGNAEGVLVDELVVDIAARPDVAVGVDAGEGGYDVVCLGWGGGFQLPCGPDVVCALARLLVAAAVEGVCVLGEVEAAPWGCDGGN
jgi:hypothetical protein